MAEQSVYIPVNKLVDFMFDALVAMGVPEEDARIIADVLITSDLWGVRSHGVAHLKMYYERMKRGLQLPVTSTHHRQRCTINCGCRWRKWDGHGGGIPCHEPGNTKSTSVWLWARLPCAIPAIMAWLAIIR